MIFPLTENFIIVITPLSTLQVNGKDLSKASHDEAVEAIRSVKDPIVVQVLRRNPVGRGGHVGSTQEVHVVDVCTQTDITFEHIMALAKLRATTPPVPDICPFLKNFDLGSGPTCPCNCIHCDLKGKTDL
uniref:Uncharacterized protein n=1 Tax=Salmo trutta TaxID=8032 RepID=A0A674F799_SALTR